METTTSTSYSVERKAGNGPGRPKINITQEQLLFFVNEGYSIKKMSVSLNCSMSVITKKLHEYQISMKSKYTNISNEELKNKIIAVHKEHPNCGYKMMEGYLKSQGTVVQRCKLREMLKEIDPNGVENRWHTTIKRRVYNVTCPNSLWHMDAHCKLSRWGFIIHGCIDGYSRLIVYLRCTTSIQAQPVLDMFVKAVKKYGLPSRVRSDHGYENIFVAFLMNFLRGIHRGSHVTGPSTHNQRIERLWVDVVKEVVDITRKEIYSLEANYLLDPTNIIHRYCIQKVFLSVINRRLDEFRRGWNYHKIRTAGNKSPRQVWIDGFFENYNSNRTAMQEILDQQQPLYRRVVEAFQSHGVNIAVASDYDLPLVESLFTATLNINEDQQTQISNICDSDLTSTDKYLAMLECVG